MVNTGRHPHIGFEPQQPCSTLESANEFAEHIALGIEEAKVALTKTKDEYTMYYNRQREPVLVFAPWDRVWLDGSDITTNRLLPKLPVMKVTSSSSFLYLTQSLGPYAYGHQSTRKSFIKSPFIPTPFLH
jgi:hypothetical protein